MGRIDKEYSRLRVGIEVHIMKAIVGRAELNDTTRSGNDKYAAGILAVVGDRIFATQMVEQQDIGNTVMIEVALCATKIPYLVSDHCLFDTMDFDWLGRRKNVRDVGRFVKRLTVDWLSRIR